VHPAVLVQVAAPLGALGAFPEVLPDPDELDELDVNTPVK
jgi:hypothetical protein